MLKTPEASAAFAFAVLSFGFASCFVLRISDFRRFGRIQAFLETT